MRAFISLFLGLVWAASLSAVESPRPQYELVYSVQVATYQYADYGQRIASQYEDIPMLCRVRDNGLFTLYYGAFETFADAKLHLQDYELFADLNAYVVKLQRVSFEPCEQLGQKILESKAKAFSRRECSDCDVEGLVESFLPEMGTLPH